MDLASYRSDRFAGSSLNSESIMLFAYKFVDVIDRQQFQMRFLSAGSLSVKSSMILLFTFSKHSNVDICNDWIHAKIVQNFV